MRHLSLQEWERKYIVRPLERFNQKNTMFNRAGWDHEINGLVEDWSFTGAVGISCFKAPRR